MENPIEDSFIDIKDQLKELVETRISILKLNLAEKISKVVYLIILSLVILAVLGICITFFSLSAALWLTSIFGSKIAGFVIIASFYLLLAMFIIFFRRKFILNPILKNMIAVLFSEEDDDEK